uniref:Germin-like protein n=2 Tax=Barbula unguiculata TaxID=96465 RepID=Q8GSQ5_9BRYO|nr:germin-like protein [Barbula unguiculata]
MYSRSMWTTVAVLLVVGLVPMAMAGDEDGLQDFCVRDTTPGVAVVNGFPCKPAAMVTADDFKFAGLKNPGNTNNVNKANVTAATVIQWAGLNTLGISAVRIDYAKGGINPPHIHPRATELLILLKGELYVGFVSTANVLFATTIYPGEAFVFPKGLIHFQLNVGKEHALAFAGLSSQNPGVQQVAPALFTPDIKDEVLEKGFRIDTKTVDMIQAQFRV